jgi:F-type H+-transporting ATPase subunit gamma
MDTLEALQRKMRAAGDMRSVVKTMKGLAAVNIRQCQEAAAALGEYHRTVERAFQALLRSHPEVLAVSEEPAGGSTAVVAFGTDQGMCGAFNGRLAEHAARELAAGEREPESIHVLAVGRRISGELADAGLPPAETLPLPGSIEAVAARVQEVLLHVELWREQGRADRVWLFHHRPRGGASYQPRTVLMLPINPHWLRSLSDRKWPARSLPTFTMPWRDLLASLVRQHIFAVLYRAFAESMAAENAARLASMQAAEKNVEERLDMLTAWYHLRRQSAITEELLDVVAGFETLERQGK